MADGSRSAVAVIMAGGTGGHVYSGLAVAEQLRSAGMHVVWLGTGHGLEAEAVPAAGFDLHALKMTGVRRRGLLAYLLAPWLLSWSFFHTLRVFMRRQPGLVLGMGGYAALPGGLAAVVLGIPLFVHEQNAIAGWSNRLLACFSNRVMLGFPDALSGPKTQHTGNPVRRAFCVVPKPEQRWQHRTRLKRLLVVGGSQGAEVFNRIVPAALAKLAGPPLQVRQQTGRGKLKEARDLYRLAGSEADLFEFADDMPALYAWADLVISRAGAGSIAELCAVGAAAVLVPYPYAVDNHQLANARFLSERGAAVLLEQSDFSVQKLAALLMHYSAAVDDLLEMACRARALSPARAAHKIADLCRREAA